MELRHLEYFIAVAEEKSFSQGAKRLHMAQPPLSMQIKGLENELGAPLFNRLSRGVSLTEVGRLFLEEARCILNRAKTARQNIQLAVRGIIGSISIGVVPTIVDDQLAVFLQEFRSRHPKVSLDIHEIHSTDQISALLKDQLDIGFLRTPINEPELETLYVSEESMILAVPSNHPFARLKRIDWKLLDGQPLVILDTPHATAFNHQFLAICQEQGVSPVIVQYSHSIHMKMWLVSAGFGISPTSNGMRYIIRPNLSFCDLPATAPKLTTVMAWKRSNTSPVVRNLIQIVREVLARE
jgi:DNA-binding transcriptional LysR family regulator